MFGDFFIRPFIHPAWCTSLLGAAGSLCGPQILVPLSPLSIVARSVPDFALLLIASPPPPRSLFCLKDILLPGLRPSAFCISGKDGEFKLLFLFFGGDRSPTAFANISFVCARAHNTHTNTYARGFWCRRYRWWWAVMLKTHLSCKL